VVVIGAGLAGLAVARQLKDAGWAVVVLEARDRLGGRIHTSRQWPQWPMDLGASWVHGLKGNPLTALAREAGARMVETSYDSSLTLDTAGRSFEPDDSPAQAMLNRALKAAEQRSQDQSVMAALEALPQWPQVTPKVREGVLHHVNATLEQEYGGAADELSAWHGSDSAEFGGGDALFPDGFDQLVGHAAKGLDVRLLTPVAKVAPGRVTLADGRELLASHIVVTVPLGVLQAGSIRFEQDLLPGRTKAIESLRMGLLNKCWLRFDRVHWPSEVDWIEWQGPEVGRWGQWVSLAQRLKAPVLLGFNAAHSARSLEALSDNDTAASAHDALRAMFGNGFPAPQAAQITRWGRDPQSLGSYSFNAIGTSRKTREALGGADWEGALWFAGEATEPAHFGTAHGAWMSGLRVARAMVQAAC
jgi:monoamine oxidase